MNKNKMCCYISIILILIVIMLFSYFYFQYRYQYNCIKIIKIDNDMENDLISENEKLFNIDMGIIKEVNNNELLIYRNDNSYKKYIYDEKTIVKEIRYKSDTEEISQKQIDDLEIDQIIKIYYSNEDKQHVQEIFIEK